MPQYWVLHHTIIESKICEHYESKLLIAPYCGIPEDVAIAVDDSAFFFVAMITSTVMEESRQ